MIRFEPVLWIVIFSRCCTSCVSSPSIVSVQLASTVIVPVQVFFMLYILQVVHTAVGSVTVNVQDVQSIVWSLAVMVYVHVLAT